MMPKRQRRNKNTTTTRKKKSLLIYLDWRRMENGKLLLEAIDNMRLIHRPIQTIIVSTCGWRIMDKYVCTFMHDDGKFAIVTQH